MNDLFDAFKILFCISGTIFILMFLIKSSVSYQMVLNSHSYNTILKIKKLEGFIFGASLATCLLSLVVMGVINYNPIISYIAPSIDATIN